MDEALPFAGAARDTAENAESVDVGLGYAVQCLLTDDEVALQGTAQGRDTPAVGSVAQRETIVAGAVVLSGAG